MLATSLWTLVDRFFYCSIGGELFLTGTGVDVKDGLRFSYRMSVIGINVQFRFDVSR